MCNCVRLSLVFSDEFTGTQMEEMNGLGSRTVVSGHPGCYDREKAVVAVGKVNKWRFRWVVLAIPCSGCSN